MVFDFQGWFTRTPLHQCFHTTCLTSIGPLEGRPLAQIDHPLSGRGNGWTPHHFPRWIFPSHNNLQSFLGYLFPTRKKQKKGVGSQFLEEFGNLCWKARRFPSVALALAREGVHRSTCRGPQKSRRGSRGALLPRSLLNLADFVGTKPPTSLPPWWISGPTATWREKIFSRRQAAGGKQVGRRVLPISNFRGRKRQWPGESQREHWQPTLVEMTRHLNITTIQEACRDFAVRYHSLHPWKHKLRGQNEFELHVPRYVRSEDTQAPPSYRSKLQKMAPRIQQIHWNFGASFFRKIQGIIILILPNPNHALLNAPLQGKSFKIAIDLYEVWFPPNLGSNLMTPEIRPTKIQTTTKFKTLYKPLKFNMT